ncbi:MAG: YitT family protein [Saprospirales bacterium]|nr:MAG: YitT family protein [Saprospirales bacterium]
MARKEKVNWASIFSVSSIVYTVLGVFLAVVALQGFMVPNKFLDGGVTGIVILLVDLVDVPIGVLLFVINLPFIFMGYYKIGKTFAIHALIAVTLMGVLMHVVSVPVVTTDRVLIAVFGGFLIGLGIGLVIRGGGVIDGLEVVAEYTYKKSGFSTSEVILLINSLILLAAAFEFGIETAMYSILTYFTAMKVTDYVVDGFEEYTTLSIVSHKDTEVRDLLIEKYSKALTIYKGERGYLPGTKAEVRDCDIIMLVVTRLEIHRLKTAIRQVDPNAFFFTQGIKEVRGGVVKRNLHEH